MRAIKKVVNGKPVLRTPKEMIIKAAEILAVDNAPAGWLWHAKDVRCSGEITTLSDTINKEEVRTAMGSGTVVIGRRDAQKNKVYPDIIKQFSIEVKDSKDPQGLPDLNIVKFSLD